MVPFNVGRVLGHLGDVCSDLFDTIIRLVAFEQISRAFPIHVEHMGGVKRDRPS